MTEVKKLTASQAVANGVRSGVKMAAETTNPANVALLHFGKNFANGDTFGEAVDHSIDQTVNDYKNIATPFLNITKKGHEQLVKTSKQIAEDIKPKDKIEMLLLPPLIPAKRAVEKVIQQWNNLPTLAK